MNDAQETNIPQNVLVEYTKYLFRDSNQLKTETFDRFWLEHYLISWTETISDKR